MKVRQTPDKRHSWGDVLGSGLLAAALAYGNFYWFFVRNHLDEPYFQPGMPDHTQALTLAFLTALLCFMAVLAERQTHLTNRQLTVAGILVGLVLANILYNPWISPLVGTVPLGVIDILCAAGAVAVFMAVRAVVASHAKHSRAAVLALHAKKRGRKVIRPEKPRS